MIAECGVTISAVVLSRDRGSVQKSLLNWIVVVMVMVLVLETENRR